VDGGAFAARNETKKKTRNAREKLPPDTRATKDDEKKSEGVVLTIDREQPENNQPPKSPIGSDRNNDKGGTFRLSYLQHTTFLPRFTTTTTTQQTKQ